MGFVDDTAMRLGFVKYDTEGEYAGYTSSSKSYPENYIEFSAQNYQRFLTIKRPVTLMRVTRIQLVCPDCEFLDRLCQLLADAKCPAEADRRNLSLAYSKQHEPAVTNAVKTLGKEYQIKIEDAGAG